MAPALLGQSLVEHGMLDGISAAITSVRNRIDLYVGSGNSTYVLLGAVVIVLFVLLRRRH